MSSTEPSPPEPGDTSPEPPSPAPENAAAKGRRGFDLEPEDQAPPPRDPPPDARWEGAAGPEAPGALPGEGGLHAGVDERTLAERRGLRPPRGHEALSPPAGWPIEALGFPFRSPGPWWLLGIALGWTVLPLKPWSALLALVGVFEFVLAGVAEASAGGGDRPRGGTSRLLLPRGTSHPSPFALLGRLLALALAVGLAIALANWMLNRPARWILILPFGAAVGLILLSRSLRDGALLRPHAAGKWLLSRPIPLTAGGLLISLAFLLPVRLGPFEGQRWAAGMGGWPVPLLLRGMLAWGLLVGARLIGVCGRSWSGSGTGPQPPVDPAPDPFPD